MTKEAINLPFVSVWANGPLCCSAITRLLLCDEERAQPHTAHSNWAPLCQLYCFSKTEQKAKFICNGLAEANTLDMAFAGSPDTSSWINSQH